MKHEPYTIILAPNASIMTGPGTNTIVLGSGVEGATVIDPGDDDPEHLEAIIREGAKRDDIRRILITHGHPDHVGGAVALRRRLHVSIYAFNREGVPDADEEITDGMIFPAGNDSLRAIFTPGHRFDHLCFLMERQKVLFAGDLIAGSGTVVISPPEGDLLDYLNSLKRLQTEDIDTIVPAHGPVIGESQAKIEEYITHRMLREQQIIAVLRQVPAGADGLAITALVQVVYADVDPRLHPVAARSVEAHLLKLHREERVHHENELWRLR